MTTTPKNETTFWAQRNGVASFGVNTADVFSYLGLDAGHAAPGRAEGEAGEVDAPEHGARHAQHHRDDLVAPHLGHRERLKREKKTNTSTCVMQE